ncbi:hypothetical protein K7432_017241 [Basidiobolus ranarum]|uniref:Uncharacterized protein n=1 Tax=Basidiobolus ranarum TaxID=34480 RepID=A0ABR2VLQ3_9FUNG
MDSVKTNLQAASGAIKETLGHATGNQRLEDKGADQYAQAQVNHDGDNNQSSKYNTAVTNNIDPSFGNQDPSSVTNSNISQGKVDQNS